MRGTPDRLSGSPPAALEPPVRPEVRRLITCRVRADCGVPRNDEASVASTVLPAGGGSPAPHSAARPAPLKQLTLARHAGRVEVPTYDPAAPATTCSPPSSPPRTPSRR